MHLHEAQSRREICAGIPRSGTTLMFRAMAGLPPGSTTPHRQAAGVVKTHSFRPEEFADACRAVFLFGDPVASVLSTRRARWDAQHFADCGAPDRDPATTDIFVEDALNYERMFDAWMQRQSFDLICIRYETLHANIREIEAFFGRHLFIPPWQPRETVPEAEEPRVRQIAATYAGLIAKVAAAPDIAVFRRSASQTGKRAVGWSASLPAGPETAPSKPPVPEPALAAPVTGAAAAAAEGTECPICGAADSLVAFRGRPNEQCKSCRSLVRTRAMYLVLLERGLLPDRRRPAPLRIAHFAPEPALFTALTRDPPAVRYQGFDIEPERYRFARGAVAFADICKLDESAAPASFDLVLHNHVLEHVPCTLEHAMSQLRAIMAPGATQMFSVPMRAGAFREDLDPSLPAAVRLARFAQEDHMRLFGTDDVVAQMKAMIGGELVVPRLSDFLSEREAQRYGVHQTWQVQRDGGVDGATMFLFTA